MPANSSINCIVQFQSSEVGKFSETLMFEVKGGERNVPLLVNGVCDFPQISSDYRNVFYKKVRMMHDVATLLIDHTVMHVPGKICNEQKARNIMYFLD